MDTKLCARCKLEKPLNEYHKYKASKDGLQRKCKSCAILMSQEHHRIKGRAPRNLNRASEFRQLIYAIINSFKEKYGCSFCTEKDSCCLDFHHISTDKEANVSYFAGRKSTNLIIAEINKCIVVCANCHRKIHSNKLTVDGLSPCSITKKQWTDTKNKLKHMYSDFLVKREN